MKQANILVVGSGMAGIMASLTAASKGANVRLLGKGVSALSIASGCIDLLGYATPALSQPIPAKQAFTNPWEGMQHLLPNHPYSLLGQKNIRQAFGFFTDICKEHGWEFTPTEDANKLVLTAAGTFKPTYLCATNAYKTALLQSKRILVLDVEGVKDSISTLVHLGLQANPDFAHAEIVQATLPLPYTNTQRNLTPLDIAHLVDTPAGKVWLIDSLKALVQEGDYVVMAPILGIETTQNIFQELQQILNCKLGEFLIVPPGVGGYRLERILKNAMHKASIDIYENIVLAEGDVEGTHCKAFLAEQAGTIKRYEADAYILATGGILGGGITAGMDCAYENILRLPISLGCCPESRSCPQVFGAHEFAQMGIAVNKHLNPIAPITPYNPAAIAGEPLLENVFVAGRNLAHYDFAAEKSGNGVALSSGYHAALQALEYCNRKLEAEQ